MEGSSGRLLLQLEAGSSSQDGQQMAGIEVRHIYVPGGVPSLPHLEVDHTWKLLLR
jgi:hypothetical protein